MTTHQDNDNDDFSNVTWSDHVHDQAARSAAAAATESPARAIDEAGNSSSQGIGREKLECTVGSPIKENDGTKDAFVSYLVTTHVCPSTSTSRSNCRRLVLPPTTSLSSPDYPASLTLTLLQGYADRLLLIDAELTIWPLVYVPVLPERSHHRKATLHRLRLLVQAADARLSGLRRPAHPGQATHGIRPRRSLW